MAGPDGYVGALKVAVKQRIALRTLCERTPFSKGVTRRLVMICFTPWRWASSLALLCTIAVASSDARAGFTPINFSHSPRNSREATHEQILEHTYGGDFTADGMNFSNGSVTVTRID